MQAMMPCKRAVTMTGLHATLAQTQLPLKRLERALRDALGAPAIVATLALATLGQFGPGTAHAASFSITSNSTTAQTLAAGQTGSIAAGKSLTVSGGTVAVTITGNGASLSNLGSLVQTGTGRAIRDNTGVTGLLVTNGALGNTAALMQTADADVIQMNVAAGSATLNNYGSMISLNASKGGSQAVDFSAITSGANTINNYTGALMKALEADAVRPGVNGVVYNAGTIFSSTSTGSSSDGVDVQNNTSVQILNDTTGLIDGARHGITGGALTSSVSFTAVITNNLGGVIRGNNGSGINLDGFNANQLVTILNAGTIVGNGVTGDGDGVDVDGLVNITNTGTIRSVNAFSLPTAGLAYSEGITVGGGTIINSGVIEGLVAAGNTNAVGRGISLSGNDVLTGPFVGTREGLYGNAVVTNQAGGLIRGQTDSAIVAEGAYSGFTVTINNQAGGTIQGGSATAAAIRTGLDNDTVNNAGSINGLSSGKAIDLGAGNNTLNVTGGSASIIGDISGGIGGTNRMTIIPGAGNAFVYTGSISNFTSVEVGAGSVTLSGISTYTGATVVNGGVLTLDGDNRLSANSTLTLNGGTLKLANAGGANGQTFASLAVMDNATVDLGDSSMTFKSLGTVSGGKTLTVLSTSPVNTTEFVLRFLGDYAADANFLALIGATTVNGLGVVTQFDGTYTNVMAVPEPDTYAMALTALAAIGVLVRRRKATASI